MEPRSLKECDSVIQHAEHPCRICGQMIAREFLPTLVLLGDSKCHRSRAAHAACVEAHPDKKDWAFPEDA